MKSVLVFFALGACSSTQPGQFPTGVGGTIGGAGGTSSGGGGGGTTADARPGIDAAPTGFADATGVDAPIVHGHVVGRLCAVHDLRTLTPCVPLTGTLLHVHVTPGGGDALVAADGSYDVPTIAGAPVIVSTSTTDPTYFGSATSLALDASGDGDLDLPVMTRDDETTLAATNAVTLAAGTGILVVHVVASNGAAAGGATLSTQGAISPRYDAGDPFLFTPTPPTGLTGTALYFGLIDTQDYTVTSLAGATQTFEAVVVADTLTFTTATLKPQ